MSHSYLVPILLMTLCHIPSQAKPAARGLSVNASMTGDRSLRLEIRSRANSTIALIPTVQLRNRSTGENYWSPFDLSGRPLPVNGRVAVSARLTIIELDFNRLKWARSRSAVWPSNNFDATVAQGEYDVVINFSSSKSWSAHSNVVTMTVRANSKQYPSSAMMPTVSPPDALSGRRNDRQ
jgi:hypothetical protein